MHRIFRVTNLPSVIALAVVTLIWTFAESQNRSLHQQAVRQEVFGSASVLRAQIEGTLSSNIQLVRGLIATLVTEPEMSAARFSTLAEGLMQQDSLIRNLAAAPDMTIRYVYPLAGNEAALGLNYLTNPQQRDAALLARDTGSLVLAGPVDLVQGGRGFISRFPVFIDDGTEPGRFWGLVSSVMDADRLFDAAGLSDDSLQIQVTLRALDDAEETGQVFYGDPAVLAQDPVQMLIKLPVGYWELSAIPLDGWHATPANVWMLRLWLLLGGALIIIPSFVMGRLLDERADNVKKLNLALRRQTEANNRYQSVSRISRAFTWEQDAERRLTYLSSNYQQLTGMNPQALLGQELSALAHRDSQAQPDTDWAWLAERLGNFKTFSDFVCLAATHDDSEIWLQLSGSPVLDEQGAVVGYQGAGMDVTTLQRARQAADASSRAKSLFLANMSHEIRTPLNGVLGMAQVLEGILVDPDKRFMVKTIRESGESLNNILNDILDLSKIDAERLQLENKPFQPEEALKRIVELHRLGAEEKGVSLSITGQSKIGPAREGDVHRFGQILHNLISNAVKFTENGHVTVEVTNIPGEALTLRVTDTGSGMTAEQVNRVFDAFFQGDSSIARRYGGTGLGMSIVQRLVSLMEGSIDVSSVPGEGTSIFIVLPLPQRAFDEIAALERSAASDLSGLRLLAADDNATNRKVLEAMLNGTGVMLTLVDDGQQAIDAWRDEDFDVVMLDISMPVVGGIAALRQIAQDASLTGRKMPPTIAFTANVMAHQVKEYLDAGFLSCVSKPLNRADLLDALNTARQ